MVRGDVFVHRLNLEVASDTPLVVMAAGMDGVVFGEE
jgi:hypothetical protein